MVSKSHLCVRAAAVGDRPPLHLLLVSIYLLLLLLGVGEWGLGGGSQCAAGPRECFHKQEHVL